MAIGNENCIAKQTNDGQRKQQNGTPASASNTRHADQWEDLKRDGKTKSTTSSNLKKLKRQKAMKKMTHGSGWQKIEEDGKKWKANTNTEPAVLAEQAIHHGPD